MDIDKLPDRPNMAVKKDAYILYLKARDIIAPNPDIEPSATETIRVMSKFVIENYDKIKH